MDIVVEWHTKRLDSAKKEELEGEIKRNILGNIEKLTKMKLRALVVSLFDDATTATSLIKGEIFRDDVPQKLAICKMKIDQGFLMHCKKTSWYQPSHKPHLSAEISSSVRY